MSIQRLYAYIFWACYRAVRRFSHSERTAQWKARTIVFCLNVQLTGWLWPLSGVLLKKKDLIDNSNVFYVGAAVLLLNIVLRMLLLRDVQKYIPAFESFGIQKRRILDSLVVGLYLVAFLGFIFFVSWGRQHS